MNPIWNSALEQAASIRNRSLSARELVQLHLDHIESINPSVNALVQLNAERALARADAIDAELQSGGDPGTLAGVPFTVKDNIKTAGLVTAIGVPERRNTVPDRDATVVHRMKAAGAILLGKTNCPPWGGGLETDNPVYGRTVNPYDPARTPGGSSGGEAAAIASGMSPMGIGSDSGGSLRYPAHFCGIATIKPTAGLIPLTGALDDVGPFGGLRDPRTQLGPMARSVADLEVMLPLLAGPDQVDASAVSASLIYPSAPGMLRVAVQLSSGEIDPTPETAAAVESAADVLTGAGASVSVDTLPDEGLTLTRQIWRSYGGGMSSTELYEILAEWDAYRSRMLQWFQQYDLILRPVNATPAPLHGLTDPATLYTVPFSLTGWPAAVVRTSTSPEGLPIGVQLVAHSWHDVLALRTARALEAAFGGWQASSFH